MKNLAILSTLFTLAFGLGCVTEDEPTTATEESHFEMMEEAGGCTTIDTWVSGSSCNNCFGAACSQFRGGDASFCNLSETGASCSSGTFYTTCSRTFCTQ